MCCKFRGNNSLCSTFSQKSKLAPRSGEACNPGVGHDRSSETVSSRIKQLFVGGVTKVEVGSVVCC